MPCGRTCRNATIRANTITWAIDAVVVYSTHAYTMPSTKAAITAPLICPTPPTTTTRKALMM